jgi:predicted N-formylglutamate amidohydrolase
VTAAGSSLFSSSDPAPVLVANEDGESAFVIVVDHAGHVVPGRLGELGLPRAAFGLHIAYDLGAAALAERLGAVLDATVITQTYSRLVIDCNRAPGAPGSIVEVSDGVTIPGNLGLSAGDRAERAAAIHTPYHQRIGEVLGARRSRGRRTVLLCQHSFTPVMGGVPRPWHVGVLHLGDSAISDVVLTLLPGVPGWRVGDNEPYAMDGTDFTAPFHCRTRGCEMLELEVRQDLIADPAGVTSMAARLAPLLVRALTASGEAAAPVPGEARAPD